MDLGRENGRRRKIGREVTSCLDQEGGGFGFAVVGRQRKSREMVGAR